MCPPWERMTNNSRLDHSTTAALICSWLIMSQQVFKTCFRWSMSLIFCRYASCMGFRSGALDGQFWRLNKVGNSFCNNRSSPARVTSPVYKQVTSLMTRIHDPVPALYQRIFYPVTNVLHRLADSDLCGAFWCKPLDSTANGCKTMVYTKLCAIFLHHSVEGVSVFSAVLRGPRS